MMEAGRHLRTQIVPKYGFGQATAGVGNGQIENMN